MPRPSASPAPASEIVVYENGGDLRLDVRTDGETVWLTQEQMCRLFGRERSVITKHIRNVFKEGELEKKVVYAKIAYTTPRRPGADQGRRDDKTTRRQDDEKSVQPFNPFNPFNLQLREALNFSR